MFRVVLSVHCAYLLLFHTLFKLEQKQSSRKFLIGGLNKLLCFSTNLSF